MNVLYLDDDSSNRLVMGDMLTLADAVMLDGETTEEALKVIRTDPVALVLADFRLIGIDGIAAIRGALGRDASVVVMDVDLDAMSRQRCEDVGADAVIAKPVAMDTLFAILRRIAA